MSDRLDAATKCVAIHRPDSLAWRPFEALGPHLVEDVRRIREQNSPDLILSGSSTLTSTPLEHASLCFERALRRGRDRTACEELALERYEMQLQHPAATTNTSVIEPEKLYRQD